MITSSDDQGQFQRAYNQYECQQLIKDALDDMERYGYDFSYSTQVPLVGRIKEMVRNKIYLRFNCKKCQNEGKPKRFTSTRGTINIRFQLKQIKQKRKFPFLLVFEFRIYRMKCLGCGVYGQAEIYDSQLQKIQDWFCQIVANILNNVPPNRPTRIENPIQVPDLFNHKHEECQACQLGKCHPGSCPRIRDV